MSGSSSSSRCRGGDSFLLPRRPPAPVTEMGCGCGKAARVLGSLFSSLTCRGGGGASKSKPAPDAHASSSSSTAFTSIATGGGTTSATTLSLSSVDTWGPATYTTNTLFEDDAEATRRQRRRRRKRRRRRSSSGATRRGQQGMRTMVRGEEAAAVAVAVEVDSAAPYEDFRESMVAMVVEKEMYAWEDLNALLHGFLSLNSPRHHPLILHAFADLWTPAGGVFCPPSPCLGH